MSALIILEYIFVLGFLSSTVNDDQLFLCIYRYYTSHV